jgi:hypothetical protein
MSFFSVDDFEPFSHPSGYPENQQRHLQAKVWVALRSDRTVIQEV